MARLRGGVKTVSGAQKAERCHPTGRHVSYRGSRRRRRARHQGCPVKVGHLILGCRPQGIAPITSRIAVASKIKRYASTGESTPAILNASTWLMNASRRFTA